MYKKTILNNGLRIITHRMPRMQSLALGIWIKTGGRYENEENKGISHFLEHLLFKGSKKYSCRQLKEAIEGVGGAFNGFTSEELTCYLVKLPSRYLGLALDVLSDMVINPLLKTEDIDKERTVILEEIKMYKDLPQNYVHDLLDELMWPGQPLGLSVIGSEQTVSAINREKLKDFKESHYTPANIVVSAAGLLDHDKLSRKVGAYFSRSKGEGINRFVPVRETQARPQVKILNKTTEQTHLAIGMHGFKRDHPLKHALGLLHVILGGNMSSRLFNELRENRGLAYEIGTQIKRYHDTGAFLVHAGIDNNKVHEAIGLIMKELSKAKTTLVSRSEFTRAKEFYLGQLMLALEDTLDNMLWIGEATAALDKTFTLESIVKEVKKVSREDLRDVARKIFLDKNLNLALIGPVEDSDRKIYNQLGIG